MASRHSRVCVVVILSTIVHLQQLQISLTDSRMQWPLFVVIVSGGFYRYIHDVTHTESWCVGAAD